MTRREFRLPDPGEGLVEAEIVTWRVAVGDVIKINDIVVEIETSKSIVELPSPYAGTVSALLAAEGELVEVGRPIIGIEDGEAAEPAAPAGDGSSGEPANGAAAGGRVPNLIGYGPKTGETRRRPRRGSHPAEPVATESHDEYAATLSSTSAVSRPVDAREPLHVAPAAPVGPPLPEPGPTAPEPQLSAPASATGAVMAKPPVRKLAKDLGIDLATVTGTGPDGMITRDDVQSAGSVGDQVEEPDAEAEPEKEVAAPVTAVADDGHTRIPIKGVRKATAAAMVSSAFTAPHVTEWVTCDVSETVELVARLKERREFRGVRISPLLVVSKAVCLALGRVPQLNSSWDDATQHIVLKSTVNLGIAAATPRGLVVPNVKNAQALSLLELATAINDIVTTAREGKTQPAAMSGGTFTITNVGTFGVDAGTPILNPGEAGILCIGQIARRPWVTGSDDDERIEPRWVTTLAVSFDHRLADGEQASIFLATVAQTLTDPGLALLF